MIRKNECECFKNKVDGIISSQAMIEISGKGSETRNEAKDFKSMPIKFPTSAGQC